jgi:capsular exopolysaccharide synthesis family protein
MELREYLRGLRRHWLAIALMTLVGLGAAFGWYAVQTPVYQATAIGLVQTREVAQDTVDDQNLIVPQIDSFARTKVPTYIQMATWRDVAEGAIEELDLAQTPDQAVTRITIENPPDTNMIRITATGETPEDAAALAEVWLRSLANVIEQTEGDGTEGSAPVTIFVTQSAILPSTPIFPDLTTSLIVGAVLGLGVGIAFALMRTASDRRIRGSDGVESRTGLPVVGTIPLTGTGDSRLFDRASLAEPGARFAVSEALRSLRTNLQFMDVDNPPRAIVVTSPVPGDGKSTIACNLAQTLAAGGKPVVLVDGDLRRSTVAKTMGLPGGAGLSDVLSGRAEIADVLQRTTHFENLLVLTAGSTPPNPSEVLGSERMRKLIEELAEYATVIIDAPPLLPVTDGAVLTHQADGALIVVSMGKTTYDLLEKSLDTVAKAGGRALGVVLNKAPIKGVDASAYSYEYRREYGTAARTTVVVSPEASEDSTLDVTFGAASPRGAGAPKEKVPSQRARRA